MACTTTGKGRGSRTIKGRRVTSMASRGIRYNEKVANNKNAPRVLRRAARRNVKALRARRVK